MFTWGLPLTAAAVLSTWIATGPEGLVGQVFHVCSDGISSLFSPADNIDNSHPPHPNNCSTCLFAIGDNDIPILVGQKLPHTNYSQFKLLLLPKEDSYTITVGQPESKDDFFGFPRSHFGKVSAIAILPIIAVIALCISSPILEVFFSKYSPVIEESTTADPALSINVNGKNPGADATQYDTSESTLWERCTALLDWKQHPNIIELEKSHAADPKTVAGEHGAFDEDECDTASMDGEKALKADHEQSVLNLSEKIEQSRTGVAMLQRKEALIKDQDIEIDSLREKLAFTTSKFRECRKELENHRAEKANRETKETHNDSKLG